MPVRLLVLGGLRAFLDDAPLPWVPSQRIRSALLAYLSVERESTREQLAHLLWPDEDPERARHSLSQLIYLLRQSLGEDAITGDGDAVRIAASSECDLVELEGAVERGDFTAAGALYRGGFLQDLSLCASRDFESWVDRERARAARLHRRARRGEIEALLGRDERDGAIEAARTWVEVDPFEDEGQHRLIELLAASGRRAQALEQFAAYESLLHREELEPLDETRALVARLRAGELAGEPPPALRPSAVTPSPPATTTAAPLRADRDEVRTVSRATSAWSRRRRLGTGATALVMVAAAVWLGILARPAPPTAESASAPTPIAEVAIAVLPFVNLAGDPQHDPIGRTLTSELIGRLAGLDGVHVPAAQSALAFEGANQDVRAIAEALRVGYIVDGTYLVVDDLIRINARLVNGTDGYYVWSHTYERPVAGVLGALGEIVLAVVDTLRLELLPGHAALITAPGGGSTEAMRGYLQARAYIQRKATWAFDTAATILERVVALDSTLPQAYAALAFAYAFQDRQPQDRIEALTQKATRAAHRALALDSTLAEPHLVLAKLARRVDDEVTVRRELDIALRLDPTSDWARHERAWAHLRAGRRREAIVDALRLASNDPLSPTAHYMAAMFLNHAGAYLPADSMAAVGAALDSLQFDVHAPKWPAYWNRGWASLHTGRYEQAAAYLEICATLEKQYSVSDVRAVMDGITAVRRGAPDTAQKRAAAIAVLEAREATPNAFFPPHYVADFYLLLGEKERMYRVLERGRGYEPFALLLPPFDSVRDEPRFLRLLMKYRLPPTVEGATAGAGGDLVPVRR